MPTTVVSTDVTVPVSAGTTIDTHFVITATGSISVFAAVAVGSNAVSGFSATIHGTVESYWQNTSFIAAVYSSTPVSRITVGATGHVLAEREGTATGSGAIWTTGAESVVVNHGSIVSGTVEGVRLGHVDGSLTNTGLISGFHNAVFTGGAGGQIDNSGTLVATGLAGAAVSLTGGGEISNSGMNSGNGGRGASGPAAHCF